MSQTARNPRFGDFTKVSVSNKEYFWHATDPRSHAGYGKTIKAMRENTRGTEEQEAAKLEKLKLRAEDVARKKSRMVYRSRDFREASPSKEIDLHTKSGSEIPHHLRMSAMNIRAERPHKVVSIESQGIETEADHNPKFYKDCMYHDGPALPYRYHRLTDPRLPDVVACSGCAGCRPRRGPMLLQQQTNVWFGPLQPPVDRYFLPM